MKTPEKEAWYGMRKRCYNEERSDYKYYGGRGIKMCPEWRFSFTNFYRDMGKRPSPDHSLDRIDVDGNYSKENCRWATKQEQDRNKRNTLRMVHEGRVLPIIEVAELTGEKYDTLKKRHYYAQKKQAS